MPAFVDDFNAARPNAYAVPKLPLGSDIGRTLLSRDSTSGDDLVEPPGQCVERGLKLSLRSSSLPWNLPIKPWRHQEQQLKAVLDLNLGYFRSLPPKGEPIDGDVELVTLSTCS